MHIEPACEPLLKPPLGEAAARDSSGRAGTVAVTDRYRTLSMTFVLATCATAALLVLGLAVPTDLWDFGLVAELLAAALLASTLCWERPRLTRIADCCGVLGLVWLAGVGGGVISLMGLRFQQPLADGSLLWLDQLAGIDTPRMVEWLASLPRWPETITIAYNYTVPVLCLSLAAQALGGRRLEAWRAAFCFVGSLLTICLLSILTPAKGLGMWLSDSTLSHFPNGAARYFWPSFDRFYGGADPVLSAASIDGVVSFPSFHTVMGLIIVTMWRKSPVALAAASIWFLHMLAGTVPLGGHYVVDLLGGAAVWACWFTWSRHLESRALQID